jgi:type IV pilus assembly protein PilW
MLTRYGQLGSTTAPHRQRGISLVELLVGLTVALVVVAGAAAFSASQLSDTRRLLAETQVQQDLRAAADIITRELRRVGSNAYLNQALASVWTAATPAYGTNQTDIVISGGSQVDYRYNRSPGATLVTFGFRLNSNTIEYNLDGGGWQALTDAKVLKVTNFSITRTNGPAVQLPCPKACPGGGTGCFPSSQVRQLAVNIEGEAVADPNVKRSIQTTIRVRNDTVSTGSSPQVCPA